VTPLKVGAARAVINPSLGTRLQGHITRDGPATAILDDLLCSVIALEQHDGRALVVSCDLLEFRREFTDRLTSELGRRFSVPAEGLLLCATHTHTGPPCIALGSLEADERYLDRLEGWIVAAAEQALGRLEEASLRFSALPAPPIGINRRLAGPGGVRMAPNPVGPIDPLAAVLAFERPDGTPLAALLHHGVHPTTLGVGLHVVSADYPGRARRHVEERLGGQLTTLFLQGACGDVRPKLLDGSGSFREGTEEDIQELGRRLGGAFLDGWRRAAPVDVRTLSTARRSLELSFGALPTPAELEREHRLSLRLAERAGRAADSWEARHMDERRLHLAVAAWAGEMLTLASGERLSGSVAGHIQAIAFGRELALVGFPGELFSEIGMRIRNDSPFGHTVVCGYAGGTVGYVPTRAALAEGGYEVEEAYKLYRLPAAFRDDVEEHVCREVGCLLADLYERSGGPARVGHSPE
jgi:hypothetical protein